MNNNNNTKKISVGAVVVGVGVILEENEIAMTHKFHVELPSFVAQEVQSVLSRHFGSVNSMLKLKPNVPIKDQDKYVSHKELEGLKDPD